MQKVCVTGATGFLGRYLLKELQEHGFLINAFGRNKEIGKTLENSAIVFYPGDLRNIEDLRSAVKGCSLMVHCGALSSLWGKKKDFFDINVEGTKNVLDVCIESGIKRMVFISSPSIYSDKKDRFNIIEDSSFSKRPLNHYIKSKIAAEKLICNYPKSGLEIVTLRPRALFGIGDTSIIPRLLAANDKIGIPLFRKGHNLIDVTCVENVAQACHLSLITEGIDGEIFNICNGEPLEFKSLIEMFMEKTGKSPKYLKVSFPLFYFFASLIEIIYKIFKISKEPVLTRYSIVTLAFSQTLSIKKARDILKFIPRISLNEGVEKYAKWYRENN